MMSGQTWLATELQIIFRAVRKVFRDGGKDLASAIAYWAFFSIFPLLLGMSAAAGYMLRSETAQERLFELVTSSLPGSAELVQKNVDSVVATRGTFGVVAIVGLFWSGSAAFGAISRAINRALQAKRPHPFFLSKLRYFSMTVASTVLLGVSIAISASLEVVTNLDFQALERLGIDPDAVNQMAGTLSGLAFAFLTFALIYKVTPYVDTRWRQVVPGALLAAVGFEVVKRAFLFYLSRAANFEAVYGSLSSIIVLLLWLYLSAWVLLIGADYNIVRWRERHGETDPAVGTTG
jgi:membrane protein